MQVTDSALAQLNQILKPNQFMRITIKAGGCQGFLETFDVIDHVDPTDVIIQHKVVLDVDSAQLLQNSELTHVNHTAHKGFQLKVAQAVSVCGCGKSFHI